MVLFNAYKKKKNQTEQINVKFIANYIELHINNIIWAFEKAK